MLRVPLAAAAFVASMFCLGTTTQFGRRWYEVGSRVQDHMVGDAFRYLVHGDFWPGLIIGGLIFVLGIFILAWPAKQQRSQESGPHEIRNATTKREEVVK